VLELRRANGHAPQLRLERGIPVRHPREAGEGVGVEQHRSAAP
jgi:hypothetical protein